MQTISEIEIGSRAPARRRLRDLTPLEIDDVAGAVHTHTFGPLHQEFHFPLGGGLCMDLDIGFRVSMLCEFRQFEGGEGPYWRHVLMGVSNVQVDSVSFVRIHGLS